jgi:Terminase large subunit, T4likevirus-type, N-terminal
VTATLPEFVLATYQRPPLYPKQAEFLFTPARYSVTEATTKSGKTVGCLVWLSEQAMQGKDGQNFWWVAPTFPVAKIAFRRMKRALPRELYTTNETESTITLANGAVVWFKGADKPDSLYGEDVYAAVIDEATRCKRESWHAVRTTLSATRGPIRIIGNVNGRRNWAYQLARKAEQGAPDMAYFKLTAHDAVAGGVLAADEVEDAQRMLPDSVFRELYLAEPADDAGNPFGIAAIRACVGPLSTAPAAVWGVDLAKSQDWTWAVALDGSGAVCASERWQGPWDMTLDRLGGMLKAGRRKLVDATGVGDPIVEQLQRRVGGSVEGYVFTAPSKQRLMEGLAAAIHQRAVTIPDGPLISELESFGYEYTKSGVRYSAPEGLHDDGVCALALAVQARTGPVARVTILG